ncbi:MAG: archease [Candidatus Omnitrophota bacterium]
MKTYEVIEHTADIGIRVEGATLKELFEKSGLALFQLSAEKLSAVSNEKHEITVNQRANDIEELFVNWLNELLSLSATEGLIFEKIHVSAISENSVEAVAVGSDMKNYKVNREIKAATYHMLKVVKTDHGWQAEVIFDV